MIASNILDVKFRSGTIFVILTKIIPVFEFKSDTKGNVQWSEKLLLMSY